MAELKANVEQMDESTFDENIFYEYLNALGDDAKPEKPIDVEIPKPLPQQPSNVQKNNPTATKESDENPLPLPVSEPKQKFASIPDTDVSALGLE